MNVNSIENEILSLNQIHNNLLTTSNESFPSLYYNIIYKLIPLANNEQLRTHLLPLFSTCIKRLKLLQCPSPIDELIKLITPDMLPYACNFAITFTDIAMRYLDVNSDKNEINFKCITNILLSLDLFDIFSIQSNALCHYMIDYLPILSNYQSSLINFEVSDKVKSIIGDWFIDLSLVKGGIVKDSIGSIQAGLSLDRVNRITSRYNEIDLNKLKSIKLSIITYFDKLLFETSQLTSLSNQFIILTILSVDNDSDVTIQAKYKVNGFKDKYISNLLVLNVYAFIYDIMKFVESNYSVTTNDSVDTDIKCINRSVLRSEIRYNLLTYCNKELFVHYESIYQIIEQLIVNYLESNEFVNKLHLYDELRFIYSLLDCYYLSISQNHTSINIKSNCIAVINGISTIEEFYITNQSFLTSGGNNAYSDNILLSMNVRKLCYKIITIYCKSFRLIDYIDINHIIILFKLLDIENIDIIGNLYECIENIRLLYEDDKLKSMSDISNISLFLYNNRNSKEPKKRKETLQWIVSLNDLDIKVIETLVLLSDDENEEVRESVFKHYTKLKSTIAIMNNNDCIDILKSFLLIGSNRIDLFTYASSSNYITIHPLANKEFYSTLSILYDKIYNLSNKSNASTVQYSVDNSNDIILCSKIYNYADIIYNVISNLFELIYLTTNELNNYSYNHVLLSLVKSLRSSLIISSSNNFQTSNSNDFNQLYDNNINKLIPLLSIHSTLTNRFTTAIDSDIITFCCDCVGLTCAKNNHNYIYKLIRILDNKLQSNSSSSIVGITIAYSSIIGALFNNKLFDNELYLLFEKLFNILLTTLTISVDIKVFSEIESTNLNDIVKSLNRLVKCSVISFNFISNNERNNQLVNSNIPLIAELVFNILEKLYNTIKENNLMIHKTTYSNCIQLLSDICITSTNDNLKYFYKLWTILFNPLSLSTRDINICTAICNGLWILANISIDLNMLELNSNSKLTSIISDLFDNRSLEMLNNYQSIPQLVKYLILYIDFSTKKLTSNERVCNMTLLLILLYHLNDSIPSNSSSNTLLTKEFITWSVDITLSQLVDKDSNVQDICCYILCHIYNIANELDDRLNINNNQSTIPFKILVSSQVVSVLSKEKRKVAPPGVSTAGESSQSPFTSDSTIDLTNELMTNLRNIPVDRISQAISLLRDEFGLSITNNNISNNENTVIVDEKHMLLYTLITKISKSINEPKVLFYCLSLIREVNDNNIVSIDNTLFTIYQPKAISIDSYNIIKLIPSIYLYLHDPIDKIKLLFNKLWNNLIVKQFSNPIEIYQKSIFDYLVKHLQSPQWRERQNACIAIKSLINQLPYDIFNEYIEICFNYGILVMDDIRDSIRIVALEYMKTFIDIIVTYCDPSRQAEHRIYQTIKIIIPLLLDKGMVSSCNEVKSFTIETIIKLIKTSKNYLSNWINDIVNILVEAMSAFEPNTLQYLQFHTHHMNISNDELENYRINLATNSPMNEALTSCLQLINEQNISIIITNLCYYLSKGIGLSTRISAVQSISFLCELYPNSIRSYGNKPFELIINILISTTITSSNIKKALFNCLGALAKILPVNIIIKEILNLITYYKNLKSNEHEFISSISTCLYEIIKKSGDNISSSHSIWIDILTISYIGSYEFDTDSKKTWSLLYNEALNTSTYGNTQMFLSKGLDSVILSIELFMISLSYHRRLQSINILIDILNTADVQKISNRIGILVEKFLTMLNSNTWTNKQIIFELLSLLVLKCYNRIDLLYNDIDIVLYINQYESVVRLSDIISNSLDKSITTDLTGDSTTNDSTSYSDNISRYDSWKLTIRGIISIYLTECNRSYTSTIIDKEYSIVCVRAFAGLPWNDITAANINTFIDILPSVCTNISISLTSNIDSKFIISEDIIVNTFENENAKKRTFSNVKSISAKQKTSSLFGNRYANSSNNTTSSNFTIKSVISKSTNTSIKSNSNDNGISQESKYIYDPVYRMKFLEILYDSWPNSHSSIPFDKQIYISKIGIQIISWILNNSIDTWTIKNVNIKLLGKLTNTCIYIHDSIYINNQIIKHIITNIYNNMINEKKYGKIRYSCILCLEWLISSKHRYILDQIKLDKARVNEMIKIGIIDNQIVTSELTKKVNNLFNELINN